MEERSPGAERSAREDEIDLGIPFATFRREWRKILLLALAAGVATYLILLVKPNRYQASAVIAPPAKEKRENPTLGMLATFGVSLGGTTSAEELESLFRSDDLTVRVFRKHDLWPILYGSRYDPATGKIRKCWVSRLCGGKEPDAPGDWDAIRAARDRLRVSLNRRAGTIAISFESPSAAGSAEIVRQYLDEGKNRLQEEALERAVRNKKFIEEQIGKTVDPLTRDRFYSLFGQEVEQEMMARNREQFGFRVIDSPRAPDRKIGPRRLYGAAVSMFLALIAGWIFFGARKERGP